MNEAPNTEFRNGMRSGARDMEAIGRHTDEPWRILIIDDNRHDRADVKAALVKGSARRHEFVEGELVADALRLGSTPTPPFDCMVLDFELPDGSALDVLLQLPRTREGLTQVPVVVLTGAVDETVNARVLRAGAQDFLGKSWLTAESLTRTVENAIERHAMTADLLRRRVRQQLSAELGQAAAGGHDDALPALYHRVADVLELDLIVSYGLDPAHGGALRVVASAGLDAADAPELAALDSDSALWLDLARERRPLVFHEGPEAGAADPRVGEAMARLGIRRHAWFVLEAAGQTIGMLAFASRRPGTFEFFQLEFMAGVAHHVGVFRARLRAEANLRRSEAFNRSLMDSSSDCLQVLDTDGMLSYINRTGVELLELDDAVAAVGRPWSALWPAEMRTTIERAVTDAAAGRRSSFDGYCPTSLGTPRWWEVSVTPVVDAHDGMVQHLLVVSRDVTARRDMLGAQRRASELLNLALEIGGGFVFDYDPVADVVQRSPQAARLLGTAPDLVTETAAAFFQRLHPQDRPTLMARVASLTRERPRYHLRYRVSPPGRPDVHFDEIAHGEFDAAGRLVRLVGMTVDVTSRVAIEAELRRQQAEFRTFADNSPDIMTRFDRELRHVFVNAAVTAATGLPRDAYIGRTNRELGIPEALCAEWERDMRRVFETGEPQQTHFSFVNPRGELRRFEGHFVPERAGDGGIDFILGVTRDVTERHQLEERREQLLAAERSARSASERVALAKDEFLATLSHELRSPLAAIMGWTTLMTRPNATDATLRRGIDAIARNATVQKLLIDDLLDMSRIVSGKLRMEVGPVDPALVAESAIETAQPAAQAKGVELVLALGAARGATLQGDAARLQQVLWNLLNNAVKFTPAGGRVVLSVASPPGSVEFTVTDTGCGIEPEFLPRVFDRFTQADGSAARVHGGLGLGLSIVRNLVELHGGSIAAHSEGIGSGSRFVVSLPAGRPPDGDAAMTPTRMDGQALDLIDPGFQRSSQFDSSGALNGLRLLLVDDEPGYLALGQRLLIELGAVVTAVDSAPAALASLRSHRYDLLLSDLGMPGMDGFAFIGAVRSDVAAAVHRMPAVALTAYSRPEDHARALRAGFDLCLVKPLQARELTLAWRELLAR